MKVVCLIQARETSTRFPRKIHADLCGKTVLQRVTEAACQIKGVDLVKVIMPQDYPHLDENDVLSRYYMAAEDEGANVIIRITGDCPLFDPRVGDLVVRVFMRQEGRCAYVSNVWPWRTWPDGMDCEVFDIEALREAYTHAKPEEREHVTPYMRAHFYRANVELPVNWSSVRLTVDTPEDLAWLRIALNSPKSS